MEKEESIKHSAHRFLQGTRKSLPLMGERKGPNIIMASDYVGELFELFQVFLSRSIKNGSDNILLGSCENLKLEM